MEEVQQKFILNQLNKYKLSQINTSINPKKLSIDKLSYILNEKFNNGPDMQAVLCLFEKILSSTALDKNKENKVLYTLSSSINQWITDINKLSVISRQGFVYYGNILSHNIKILIKIPRKLLGFDSLLKEYFIGLCSINRLRYILPTFVYTLGGFLCPQPYYEGESLKSGELCKEKNSEQTIYVMYENIPGKTLSDMLGENKISFNEWLEIFVQILLSLEVSQREIGFTHFDLHTGNVMVRKKTFNYDIPIDNLTYSIYSNYLPVIIDFGTSCVCVENRYIGSYQYMGYRMLNFIVSGYDMYKFLVYSSYYANPLLSEQIQKLFEFYDIYDPYNITLTSTTGIKNALDTYCSEVTDSVIAKYTPLMFLNWINAKYHKFLSRNIKITQRTQYKFLKYSTVSYNYGELINNQINGIKDSVELIQDCITVYPSYILCKYNIKILENYNTNISSKLENLLNTIKTFLSNSENVLLKLDLTRLENVFDIIIPGQLELMSIMDNVLELPILWSKVDDKLDVIADINNISYEEELKPYLQLYYTILELKLEDKFSDWIIRFRSSNIYNFYLKNRVKFSQALRWSKTLKASIVI